MGGSEPCSLSVSLFLASLQKTLTELVGRVHFYPLECREGWFKIRSGGEQDRGKEQVMRERENPSPLPVFTATHQAQC